MSVLFGSKVLARVYVNLLAEAKVRKSVSLIELVQALCYGPIDSLLSSIEYSGIIHSPASTSPVLYLQSYQNFCDQQACPDALEHTSNSLLVPYFFIMASRTSSIKTGTPPDIPCLLLLVHLFYLRSSPLRRVKPRPLASSPP